LNSYNLKYFQYNDNSLLISWPERIDENINNDVNEFKKRLETGFKQILEIRSSYCSLLLIFNKKIENLNILIEKLKNLYLSRKPLSKYDQILWNIPVCYENKFALDIDTISKQNKISKQDIIVRHSKTIYSVYLIGFLPGFMYLGGLDNALHIPRKKEPRLRVPKGSVAIGGEQTGIYPQQSPGGWNILGNTPVNLFDKSKDIPCFAKPGDKVKFFQVSEDQYKLIEKEVEFGLYELNKEVLND
jgi:inhibitor of KinA